MSAATSEYDAVVYFDSTDEPKPSGAEPGGGGFAAGSTHERPGHERARRLAGR